MAFYALLLPRDLQATIAAALRPWQQSLPRVQWVHPDDYHLTLRFISGLTREQLEILRQPVSFKGFTLELQGLKCFPPKKDRGVLWISLKTSAPELLRLQQSLEKLVQDLGFPPERQGYTPHITIARYHAVDDSSIESLRSASAQSHWGSFSADEYVLMKRRSGAKEASTRPVYEVLANFPGEGPG